MKQVLIVFNSVKQKRNITPDFEVGFMDDEIDIEMVVAHTGDKLRGFHPDFVFLVGEFSKEFKMKYIFPMDVGDCVVEDL